MILIIGTIEQIAIERVKIREGFGRFHHSDYIFINVEDFYKYPLATHIQELRFLCDYSLLKHYGTLEQISSFCSWLIAGLVRNQKKVPDELQEFYSKCRSLIFAFRESDNLSDAYFDLIMPGVFVKPSNKGVHL